MILNTTMKYQKQMILTFEVNDIMQNTNENKATAGIIKPQIIKLGNT